METLRVPVSWSHLTMLVALDCECQALFLYQTKPGRASSGLHSWVILSQREGTVVFCL